MMDKQGKIAYIHEGLMGAENHVKKSIEQLEKLSS